MLNYQEIPQYVKTKVRILKKKNINISRCYVLGKRPAVPFGTLEFGEPPAVGHSRPHALTTFYSTRVNLHVTCCVPQQGAKTPNSSIPFGTEADLVRSGTLRLVIISKMR